MIIALDIIKFIVLILITFFTCQIVTKNNKRISYIGTLLICFSTAVVEYINSGLVGCLIFGQLILISFNKLLNKEKYKYLWSIIIPFCLIGFFIFSNISFQISIGISIITMLIWLVWNNAINKDKESNLKSKKENNKENKDDNYKYPRVICLIGIIIAVIIISLFYKYSPMKSLENNSGISYLINYTYSSMLPFNHDIKFTDSSCLATMISIFPIGLIIAIIYIYKIEDKHIEFLIPTAIISIIELILILSNKITWLIPNYIFTIGFALLQIYMLIYIFSNITERLFSLKTASYIAIFLGIIVLIVPFPKVIGPILSRMLPYSIFVLESYMLLNYTDKRFWRLTSWIITFITLFESIAYLVSNYILL